MSRTQTLPIASVALVALVVTACGRKDQTRVCAPANTWSQPAWNCAGGEVVPEPEPEPPPRRDITKVVAPVQAKAQLRDGKIEILEKVQFETGSADILEESFALLDEVADIIERNPGITKIRVEGHTDSKGRKRSNKRLSQKRADAVREYLIDKGIDGGRLVAKGYGQTKPIASNKTDEGRAENRRVEFNILEGGGAVK